jgi:spermidine synthase
MTSRSLSKQFSRFGLAALLTVSGATGLVYEVLWARDFALVFGATAVGSAIVLAATFTGLALGSYLGGRLARRVEQRTSGRNSDPATRTDGLVAAQPKLGLLLYAGLEAGLAVAILAYVLIRPGLDDLASSLASSTPAGWLPLARTVLAMGVLLVPSALLGATLPAAGLVLAAGDVSGAARFYACNALGGALGAVLAVAVLLPALGTRATYLACAGLDVVLAAIAWMLARRVSFERKGEVAEDRAAARESNVFPDRARGVGEASVFARSRSSSGPADVTTDATAALGATHSTDHTRDTAMPPRDARAHDSTGATAPSPTIALVVAATSGFVGLACEVLWLRGLSGVLSNSVYSFALMLAAVLVGLVLGSALASTLLRDLPRRLAWTAAVLSLAIVGSGVALRFVPELSLALAGRFGMHSPGLGFAVEACLAVLVILPAATALGATFALALALAESAAPARRFGAVLAANTAGAVAGSLSAAFVLLPRAGLSASILMTAALAALLSVVASRPRSPSGFAPAAVAVLGIAAAAFAPPLALRWREQGAEQVLFERQGSAATVLVTADARGSKRLRVNGQYSLGGTAGLLLERRQALLPLLLHPGPRRVLVIGVGTGDTLGAAVADPNVHADGVELIPEVLEAAALFSEENRGALDHPRAHFFADDARSHLLDADDRYDVILSDLFLPWTAGAASLYSRELYETGRARLARGGLYAQWLPLHQLAVADLESIVATFLDVFPYAQLWVAYHRSDTPLALLIGSESRLRVDAERRRDGIEDADFATVLRSAGFLDPADVAPLYVGDERQLRPAVAGAPLITDDRPVLEFSAPAAYFRQPALAPEGLAWVAARLDPEPAPVDGAPPATAELREALLAAQRALLAGDRPRELKLYAQALDRAPDVRAVRQGLQGIARDRIAAGDLGTASAIATGLARAAPESAEARTARALVERAASSRTSDPGMVPARRP